MARTFLYELTNEWATEAMVAVEKADVSFQTMMAIRNKMIEAYQEVMRMQV